MIDNQQNYCVISCTKCQTIIGHSDLFVNEIIESPKEHHIKGSENIKKAKILCDDCLEELPQ